ncbi:MAG: hypothetical protein VB074_10020 [Proteiniphilum sp.]|jgi:hypothetical protein|uniref:hypothetical protein n=1 Tax=Proteiniphilum sp. TaxID=1926877 RepID=UPI00092B2954|nr:hypothetical protein [Proteiniphilum sp.]MEA5128511.1 hypothetical protein [Proteiniphilum sp.]OJV87138.1 MAG: hypothetical protein BGO34_12345 [Bacteroidia bacterium 44-10]
MEIPKINARIMQIINYKSNGNRKKFSETIGISQQSINRLFNIDSRTGKYPVATTEIIMAISEMFVDINTRWLLTGVGTMLQADNLQESQLLYQLIEEIKDLSAENALLKKDNSELLKKNQ